MPEAAGPQGPAAFGHDRSEPDPERLPGEGAPRAELTVEVPREAAGQRLDRFLVDAVPELSRARLQALIAAEGVRVDGKPARAALRLKGAERIDIRIPALEVASALPEDLPLEIVYQDADLAVVNKPAGMATHPAPGTPGGTLVNALLARIEDLSGIGGELRPGIVHRLDKDTSGLLVVAKNDRAHRALQAQIQAKTAIRRYLALVTGRLPDPTGSVEAPIARQPRDRVRMAVVPGGRRAVTHYEVVEEFKDASLLALTLETGRTHQIRVHMAHIGHPVIGDPVYSSAPTPMRLSGQLLHAWQLSFDQPRTGERLQFEVEPPAEFARALEFIRRRGFWRG